MDTTRWGPDGWLLLHSIAYCYTFPKPGDCEASPAIYKRFFCSLQHILPCVYCRRSYAQYMREIPIAPYLDPEHPQLFQHVYMIHNRVNGKLRGQGYLSRPDPSYLSVYRKFKKFVPTIDCLVGWAFLYCVVFNYPEHGNCSARKHKAYVDFFTTLQWLLPCLRIREKYKSYINRYPVELEMGDRSTLKKWLHRLERRIRADRCTPFRVRCEQIEECRVSKCDGETCRKST